MARELVIPERSTGLPEFAPQVQRLLTEAQWSHKTYIEKQVDQHFIALRGARDYVAEVTEKVGDAVDTLTKGLAEVLFTTLGVIIAALVTALTKPQEEGRIVNTVMVLYAIYLGLQALFRLASTWHSTYLLKRETDSRLTDLTPVLGTTNIETLSKPLTWRWWQFGIWLILAAISFVVLGVGVWRWVPDFVRSTAPAPTATPPVVAPTPTAVPAPTATPAPTQP